MTRTNLFVIGVVQALLLACTSTTPAPDAIYERGEDVLCPSAQGFPVCICDDSRCRWNPADPEVWTIDLELRDSFLEGQMLQYEASQGGLYTRGFG